MRGKNQSELYKPRLILLAGAALLGAEAKAYAQVAQTAGPSSETGQAVPSPSGDVNQSSTPDIIVTAQKRSERLKDVPMSITAQTGDQLAKQGVVSVADLEKVVPGFTYQKASYGSPVFGIRGISFYDTAIADAPTVSAYVDQIPLPYSVMTSGVTLDLERVEILKGPQGTLFGQNATGGAVNYIAAKPTTDLRYGGSLDYGRFNAANLEGFVSGGLSDDIKARIAIRSEQSGNWQVSQTRPTDAIGQRNFLTGRLILDIQPASTLKIEISANGWRDKSDNQAPQYVSFVPARPNSYPDSLLIAEQPVAPQNSRVADWTPGQSFRRNDWFYQIAARVDWSVSENATLTSISAYSRFKTRSPGDYDGTQFDDFDALVDGKIRSIYQEVRLAGSAGRIKWLVGSNFSDDKTRDNNINRLGINASTSGLGPYRFNIVPFYNNQSIESYAGFGSLDYKLTDTLTLQGSARYNNEHRSREGCIYDPGDGSIARAFEFLSFLVTQQPITLTPGSCVTLGSNGVPDGAVKHELNQDNVSLRGSVSWKASRTTLLYANVTRGYKAGGFPTIATITEDQAKAVTQEEVLAYEGGIKTSVGRWMDLSAAAFYYDYTNKQILNVIPTVFGNNQALLNIPKGRIAGAELDVTMRPIQGLRLNLGGTFVNSKVTKSFTAANSFGVFEDIKGQAFPNTPRWQLTSDVEYDFPISSRLDAYLGANGRFRSSTFATFGQDSAVRIPGYYVLDLRAGIEDPAGRWRAGLWARNVTNQFYVVNAAHLIDTVTRTTGMPVSYGLTLSFRN